MTKEFDATDIQKIDTVDYCYGAHPDKEDVLAIKITEGEFRDLFFCFNRMSHKIDDQDNLNLNFDYDIIGLPKELSKDQAEEKKESIEKTISSIALKEYLNALSKHLEKKVSE